MREIKFRGKRIDDGRWVYGQYFTTPLTDENSGASPNTGWFFLSGETRHCIVQNGVSFVIDENTLGQYVGFHDKNGEEIYEKDIVAFRTIYDSELLPARIGTIDFLNASFYIKRTASSHYAWMDYNVEVLGNICENSDLL